MDYVVGVSWPRSGHHMLVRLLSAYFGDSFGYCSFYDLGGACCHRIPCRKSSKIRFTKSHDFKLRVPQLNHQKYLVQYRDFTPSVVSNFELFVRKGGEDSSLSFRKFASVSFGNYQNFIRKWVSSDFGKKQLVLNYADFLANPETHLKKIVQYFAPQVPVDENRVACAIASIDGEKIERKKVTKLKGAGIHKIRDVTEFRHFDKGVFNCLKNMKLSRAEVNKLYQKYLTRNAVEMNMLRLQGFASIEALENHITSSLEYKLLA